MKNQDSLEQLNALWAQHAINIPSKKGTSIDVTSQFANLFTSGKAYFFTIDFTFPKIDFVSENAQRFTGIPREKMQLQNWLQLWHKEDYQIVSEMEKCKGRFLFEFINTDEIIHYKICQKYRLLQPDNSYRMFLNQMSTLVLSADNKIQKTLLVQTDISHLNVPMNHRLDFIHMKGGTSYYTDDMEKFIEIDQVEISLSPREREILSLVASGQSSKEIGKRLFISKNTVDTHRRNILQKMNSDNMLEVISLAIRSGWI